MRCFNKIINIIPRCRRKKKNKERLLRYKAEIEKNIQKHWPDQPIKMEELVIEQYEENVDPKDSVENTSPDAKFNFLVFIDFELDVDWMTSKSFPISRQNLVSKIECLKSLSCSFNKEKIMGFKRLIGQGIVAGILGNEIGVEECIREALNYHKKRSLEKSRLMTLSTSLFVLLVVIILFSLNSTNVNIPNYFLAALVGCFGSFLSIGARNGKILTDPSSGFLLHILDVICRYMVGGVSAVWAFYLLKNSIIPVSSSFLTTFNDYVALCFVAGFSERFVPQIVSNYEVKIKG